MTIDLPRVCIQVQSAHTEAQSSPDNKHYAFAYTVIIRSLGRAPAQLLGCYWLITNGNSRETGIQGEGVVGVQPLIAPGEGHQYASGVIIEIPLGTMQDHYKMIDENGVPLSIGIPVFQLAVPILIHQKNMTTYLIGDVHSCHDELIASPHKAEFTPGEDTLWLTGDLAAHGPGSLDVLRYVKSLGDNVCLVLGNHDLYLLAIFARISRNKPKDRLTPLLEAPDADEPLSWLRRQPLLQTDEEKRLVMIHTGIAPQWDLQTVKECARDVEAVLSSDSYPSFLDATYGDMSNNWSLELQGLGGLRFIANTFTRMRFCFPSGQLDTYSKESSEKALALLKPWFTIPDPVIGEHSTVFDHWVSPRGKDTPEGIHTLDIDCCWGGPLACLRWKDKQYFVQPSNWHKDLGEAAVS